MKMTLMSVFLSGSLAFVGAAGASTAPFTFHGNLVRDGLPVSDRCNFSFTLWDAPIGGARVGPENRTVPFQVVEGFLQVTLDFRPVTIGADPRWIEIGAQCTGDLGIELLPDRKRVYASPTARVALDAPSQVPLGVIAMWSGTLADIPSDWTLCDGTNGTPDLRDRFVRSVGTNHAVGDAGGSLTHSHVISGHQHTADPSVTSTAPDSGHAHLALGHAHTAEFATVQASGSAHSHVFDTPLVNVATAASHGHLHGQFAVGTSAAGVHSHSGVMTPTGGSGGKLLVIQTTDGVQRTHNHGVFGGGNHAHTITIGATGSNAAGSHNHQINPGAVQPSAVGSHSHAVAVGRAIASGSPIATSQQPGHTHDLDLPSAATSASSGTSVGGSNLPAYYELAYIMKIR